ncbi:FbpB family small basic protein [Virgibacillus xinjiangensis]|uniref:FbpB family small basic protein n=1 Tax=Virgibacillus xinjiangensis TaxID=393090 RepID=A0ABV7CUH9_9BACI
MRPKSLNFEQLVQKNKEELLDNEKEITKIEMRLERRQEELVKEKQDG